MPILLSWIFSQDHSIPSTLWTSSWLSGLGPAIRATWVRALGTSLNSCRWLIFVISFISEKLGLTIYFYVINMSYSIPITQIYLAKTNGKVNVNINVTDKPLSQWQSHCMGNYSHINSIQVSFAAGSQETHHWPLTTDHFCWEKILWSVNLEYSKKWKINDISIFLFLQYSFLKPWFGGDWTPDERVLE